MKYNALLIPVLSGLVLIHTAAVYGFDGYRPQPDQYDAPASVLLAEKSGKASTNQPAKDKKEGKEVPKTSETGRGNSSKSPVRPLKPFKPSEKIKADQVVDFPYDI